MGARDEPTKGRCMKLIEKRREKIKRCVHSKKEVNESFVGR